MIRFARLTAIAALVAIAPFTAGISSAASIATALNAPATGSELAPFTVSSTDIGQTLGTWTLLPGGTADFGSNVTELNDGNKYGGLPANNTTHSFTPSNNAVAQLTFSSKVDIDRIVSLTGTAQSRAGQDYTVTYSTDGIIFNLLHNVGGEPGNADAGTIETQVTIFDPGAVPLAINVEALRFTFSNVGNQSMFREIDVNGSVAAAVPEPMSVLLWSMLGVVGVAFALWRPKSRN